MIPEKTSNEYLRLSLSIDNTSRDGTRAKGSWGVNIFQDSGRIRKRFGLTLDTFGESPGQGILIYGTSSVSVRNDTLYIGRTSFTL